MSRKRKQTTIGMIARRERQRARKAGYTQTTGQTRRTRRHLMAEGRSAMAGRGKVLDGLNERDTAGFMHPTKGYRTVGIKRAMAANMTAEMKAGHQPFSMKRIRRQLADATA